MTRDDDDEKPICKDCGDPITDTYFGRERCDDCQSQDDEDQFCEDDE